MTADDMTTVAGMMAEGDIEAATEMATSGATAGAATAGAATAGAATAGAATAAAAVAAAAAARDDFSGELLFGKEKDVEKTFGKAFQKMLKLMSESEQEEMERLGIRASDLGTHSNRKGCATHISNMMQGPSGIALFLRLVTTFFLCFFLCSFPFFLSSFSGGVWGDLVHYSTELVNFFLSFFAGIRRAAWSLGNTQSRYIKSTEDNYLGRCCALLDHSSTLFAALPPHFKKGGMMFLFMDCVRGLGFRLGYNIMTTIDYLIHFFPSPLFIYFFLKGISLRRNSSLCLTTLSVIALKMLSLRWYIAFYSHRWYIMQNTCKMLLVIATLFFLPKFLRGTRTLCLEKLSYPSP